MVIATTWCVGEFFVSGYSIGIWNLTVKCKRVKLVITCVSRNYAFRSSAILPSTPLPAFQSLLNSAKPAVICSTIIFATVLSLSSDAPHSPLDLPLSPSSLSVPQPSSCSFLQVTCYDLLTDIDIRRSNSLELDSTYNVLQLETYTSPCWRGKASSTV